MTRRWKCPHCKTAGWSSDGAMPPHDNRHGFSCRQSGQISEAEAMRRLAARYEEQARKFPAMRNEIPLALYIARNMAITQDCDLLRARMPTTGL